MKTTLLVILSLLCSQILSQIDSQNKINHGDILKERMNQSSNPNEQIESSFNANSSKNNDSRRTANKTVLSDEFLLIEEISQRWESTNWVNSWKCKYSYDENNNLIESLYQDWDTSNWVNVGKQFNTYDVNNNMIEKLDLNWDGSSWVINPDQRSPAEKYSYTYDELNNMTEELWLDWDDSNWVNVGKHIYTYDMNNNLIEDLWQCWSDSSWINDNKNTYTYDANNNMILELLWTREGNNWVNNVKSTYTYDVNNNMIERLFQNHSDLSKKDCSYDVNNNLIEELFYRWKEYNWENISKHTYTYGLNNDMIGELSQLWDGVGNWRNNSKYTYTYQSITKIELLTEVIESYRLSNNYPNPFNPSTTINYSILNQSNVTLKVFDVLGSEVRTLINKAQLQGHYEIEFDGSDLTSGIYFYRIQTGEFIETKKMILLK